MKFGKLLQSRAEELKSTGLTEHFLRYKSLKKTLKQISKEDQQTEAQNEDAAAGEPALQIRTICLACIAQAGLVPSCVQWADGNTSTTVLGPPRHEECS